VSRPVEEQTATPRGEQALGFEKGSEVDVKEAPDKNNPELQDPKFWEVLKPITYHARALDFTAEVGMLTDFASVPRMFVWLLPRYGRYTKAAILHDHLWGEEVPHTISRRDADGIFRQAMRQLEVPFLRRWIMWAAVRWGALVTPDGRRGWLKEAPRVALITVLAAPIVFPPAVLVMVALVLFWGIEWIVYVPLRLVEKTKARPGRPVPKHTNRPQFPWKTA
jgi:Protein of unknown function (DUF1353)